MEEIADRTIQEIKKQLSNPDLITYVAMSERPGVSLFSVLLEHTFYKPGTSDNEKFIMHLIKWERILWFVITIPAIEKNRAEVVAKKSGIRIADGVPSMITSKGVAQFPLDMKNVFTLENEPGHPMYKGATSVEIMLNIEKQLVEEILRGDQ